MREIRGLGVKDLAKSLRDQLKAVSETFDSNDRLYVHQQNQAPRPDR